MMIVEQMLNNSPKPLLHIADVSGSALFQGDCLDIMPLIPDNSIDCIITDPPYGTTACKWDSIIPFDKMWEQLNRIIKPNGAIVLFGSEPFSSALRMSNIKNYKYDWKWDKVKPVGHLVAKHRPMQRLEDIMIFGSGKINYYPIMIKRDKDKQSKEYRRTEIMGGKKTGSIKILKDKHPQGIIVISNANQNGKVHPTQKPLELMEYLVKTYTKESETILDFTVGSGSTLVASKNLNRKFIGIEKEVKYYDLAVARVFG